MTSLGIRGLQVRFDGFTLGPIDLDVQPGVTAVLGPNGSGKTTLLRAVNGLTPATSGSAVVDGFDLTRRPTAGLRDHVYVPDTEELLFAELSLAQFWSFYAEVRARSFGDDPDELLDRAFTFADRLRLDPGGKRIKEFSLGMRRKTQIITGLMTQPRLLMVDEPQNGLDFVSSHELRTMLDELRATGATILMSNHDLDSVARIADRIVVLRDGQVVGRSEEPFASSADCERYVARFFCDA